MSDSRRIHRAIKQAILQLYPGQPQGNLARHLATLVGLVSGIVMPVNFLLYLSLLRLGSYYGDTFTVECPTGSGKQVPLVDVARALAERLIGTFVRGSGGRAACQPSGRLDRGRGQDHPAVRLVG
jgi:hypothetical protein